MSLQRAPAFPDHAAERAIDQILGTLCAVKMICRSKPSSNRAVVAEGAHRLAQSVNELAQLGQSGTLIFRHLQGAISDLRAVRE